MKKYYGIIFAVIYALIFRVLVEFNILEINSIVYLILVPIVMGYLPFLLDPEAFKNSGFRAVSFPIAGTILFLIIAFVSRLEDIGCFFILFIPYIIVSLLVSLIIRYFIKIKIDYDRKNVKRSTLFLFIIPIIFGNLEKYADKKEANYQISNTIIINTPKEVVWGNLFSVPELTNYIDNSVYNYLGFPNPIKSEYNPDTNVRLGYFNNGIILNEKVIKEEKFKKLSFSINVKESKFDDSPTFRHILKKENLVFNSITYNLEAVSESKTKLTLVCDYKMKTNIPLYGEYCSKNIISDFENKLLHALKKRIEQ